MSTPPAPTVHLDRAALAMLAHPLRSRLLDELRVSGPATATTLAAVLHTNSGATSYHLRKLADVGLVVDHDPGGKGTGRRRLWSASTESRPRDEGAGVDPDDADAQAAIAWLARDYLNLFNDRAERWLDTQDRWPADWREQVGLSDHLVQVTAGQLSALRSDLAEVLERYRRVGAGNPDAKRVSVYLCPLPVDSPRGD
ncbi:MAG TPA: helix-turn-helix domain-containing protein [Dermatophilaceae bacterium]|nr:helix-turn-helix domain-containing protein [Dermatophilaceae bacterium]